MKLFFVISLLVISGFALMTVGENEGGSTNNAPNNLGANDQPKPISPAEPTE